MKHEELKVANQNGLNDAYCPLPLSVIPNHMGINLCSVESVKWVKQEDGQLVSLTINFDPDPKETTPNVEHNRRPQGVRVDDPVGPHRE